jgi:hypothetical protein
MELAKKTRKAVRSAITRTINQVEAELGKVAPETPDIEELQVLQDLLRSLAEDLQEVNQKIWDEMLNADKSDAECETELHATSDEKKRITRMKLRMQKFLDKSSPDSPEGSVYSEASSGNGKRKTYKLPKVEIRKFSGEVLEWLSWWHQFERIHLDGDLHDSDKFQYLVQSMVEKSKAEEFIRVYPQTAANYPKAVQALQERFGKDKILKRVYVRELLKLIIKNSREKLKISKIYDNLEGHLKALESLGITQDQMDVILFPMVESCLPDDIIMAWQRSSNFGKEDKTSKPPVTEFDNLMKFIRQEVENETQREQACTGLGIQDEKGRDGATRKSKKEDVPTAASLSNTFNKDKGCVFCGKSNHSSTACFKVKNMSLEEKQQRVKSNNGCFRCLRKGHMSRNCSDNSKCAKCSKAHHQLICSEVEEKEPSKSKPDAAQSKETETTANNSNQTPQEREVLLKTVHVLVRGNNGKEVVARLLFDEGSQRSYVKTEVAEGVGCRALDTISLRNNLFGGHQTHTKVHVNYEVFLKGIHNRESRKLKLTNEDVICSSCPIVPKGPWMKELAKQKIVLTDTWADTPEVQILIGSDLWGSLMTGKMIKLNCGLVANESVFGWTLSGCIPGKSSAACSVITLLTQGERTLQEMWSLESLGIRDKADQISQEEHDLQVKTEFQESISRELDGRYVVKFPWVSKSLKLPSNRVVAQKRLERATEKLIREEKYETYERIFKEWEAEGIIEAVPIHVNSDNAHFLPHRPVFKPESLTTPVRPVFDASCKVGRNPSLNQCLEKGPNMLELIPSILLRFRRGRIGVVADIRKAFQMITVAEEDRNYQQFLWWEDRSQQVLKIYRHCRVVFGLNCSPFILAAVVDLHLNQVSEDYKEVAELLKKSLYVDNVVVSLETENQVAEFKEKSIAIFKDAKMDLRQWETSLDLNVKGSSTSVLGLQWNKEEDTLSCQVPEIADNQGSVNKRKVLSIVSQVFDPVGFTCPALLQPKIMLQTSWSSSMDWDRDWGEEETRKFKVWMDDLPRLKEVRIPRNGFGGNSRGLIQLHMFCDASKDAYAAVVFARTEVEDQVTIQLLLAKSRLAPLDKKKSKRVTIPRLELMGCLIGSRLLQNVKEALGMEDAIVHCWSDSMTALSWIRRDESWGTFVGNRVREVNRLTKSTQWRFVPGVLNPADLPSRGCLPSELLESSWWEGPTWLRESEDHWPKQIETVDEDEVALEKMKTIVSSTSTNSREFPFASFLSNIRIAGWTRRFIGNCRMKDGKSKRPFLSIQEMRRGERDIIGNVQRRHEKSLLKLKPLQVKKGGDGLLHAKT